MIFHENQEIAFNFCQLSTILLVLQKKNLTNGIENNNSDFKAAKSDTENINKLFELTKNGLFSIILDSDNAIEALSNSNHHETATLSAPKLEIYTKFLKNSLKCTIELVKMNDPSFIRELYAFISSLLDSIGGSKRANYYCESLLTLCKFESLNKDENSAKKMN